MGAASNEVRVATGEAGPPLPPQALLVTVRDTAISMQWTENPFGPVIAGYQLQAGSAAGIADLGVLPLPATARTFAVDAPPGTYFLRVIAVNAAGASAASNEAVVSPAPGVCTRAVGAHGVPGLVVAGHAERGLERRVERRDSNELRAAGGQRQRRGQPGRGRASGRPRPPRPARCRRGRYFLRVFAAERVRQVAGVHGSVDRRAVG